MTIPLPTPSTLLSSLVTLERTIAQFEEARSKMTFVASNSAGTVHAVADGMGKLRSVSIAPSSVKTLTRVELAAQVMAVVNAALASANGAGGTAFSNFAQSLTLPGLPAYGSAPPAFALFATMAERLVQPIATNQPCQSNRVFECRAGRVVAVVSAQRQVVSLVYEEPLPDYLGHLESRTVEAINCAIQAATDRADETTEITGEIIENSVTFGQLVLYANGDLRIGDRSGVKTVDCRGWALIGNAGQLETNIGVKTDVGNIVSRARVFVRERGRVHGSILTAGELEKQNLTEIDGPVTENAVMVLPELAFNVQFPSTTRGTIAPEPDVISPASAPGYYDQLHPKTRSQVFLSSGVYYFNQLFIEPDATVWIDTTNGPVIFWVRDSFTFHGQLLDSSGGFPRLFIGYVGAAMAAIESPFRGTLAAPKAKIYLATVGEAGHAGAFHGKDIEVCPDVIVCHHPFEGSYGDLAGISPPEVVPEPPAGYTIPVLSFEDLSLWSSEETTLEQSIEPVTDGTYALKIASAPGRVECISRPFNSELLHAPQGKILLDLWIGATQPNEYWVGQLQLSLSAPSANVNDAWIGQSDLSALARETFGTLEMALPSEVSAVINGMYADVTLKIVLNVNSGSGPYYLDHVRFL
ncbi:MAG: YbaB/EbfC family nucleoid-associated protein [Polyangiaceae bacterium]